VNHDRKSTNPVINQWHILGAGAMGRLFACKLKAMGLEPILVRRAGAPGELTQVLRRDDAECKFSLTTLGADRLREGNVSGLIVTTKANDAATAVSDIAHALCAGAPVVLLHNGMGVLEQLLSDHPRMELLAGTTTEGAYLEGQLLVHAGVGDTVFGRQGTPAPGWFAAFADSGERFCWTDDIDAALWKKLLINCAINPLTAVHHCRNGALAENPELAAEVGLLCEELAAISTARGFDHDADTVRDWAMSVIRMTAANQSSMLQDVLNGRATEVGYITGYLVREAQRLDVPCPRNAALLAQLDSAGRSN
jgi:2-dehydropantoate 2-reductase